jgi:hypothetical protein
MSQICVKCFMIQTMETEVIGMLECHIYRKNIDLMSVTFVPVADVAISPNLQLIPVSLNCQLAVSQHSQHPYTRGGFTLKKGKWHQRKVGKENLRNKSLQCMKKLNRLFETHCAVAS